MRCRLRNRLRGLSGQQREQPGVRMEMGMVGMGLVGMCGVGQCLVERPGRGEAS